MTGYVNARLADRRKEEGDERNGRMYWRSRRVGGGAATAAGVCKWRLRGKQRSSAQQKGMDSVLGCHTKRDGDDDVSVGVRGPPLVKLW